VPPDAVHIRWFGDLGLADVAEVGGKRVARRAVSAARRRGVRVPNGFAVTAGAYRHFMRVSGLADKVSSILSELRKAPARSPRRSIPRR
jgi:pyruvate, water dikinase